jgi:hypothetical protein
VQLRLSSLDGETIARAFADAHRSRYGEAMNVVAVLCVLEDILCVLEDIRAAFEGVLGVPEHVDVQPLQ